MTKISATIITFNEEKKILACLSSLQGVVDEIVVLDSYSTDNTAAICRQFGVKFFQQEFTGYGSQKNDAAQKATHDWILNIDADEVLSPELQKSIPAAKSGSLASLYSFNRRNIFFGCTPRYGLTNPDRILRLYNRRELKWHARQVHETLEVPKGLKPVHLAGDLIHYSKDSLEQYLSAMNKYSSLGAQQYAAAGKKSNWLKVMFSPAFTFFKGYVVKLGFLDGLPGFILAFTHSIETFLKYSKLYFLQKKLPGK